MPVLSRQHFSLHILKERIDTLHGEVGSRGGGGGGGGTNKNFKTKSHVSLYLELINVLLDLCSKGSVFSTCLQSFRPGYDEIFKLKCATPEQSKNNNQTLWHYIHCILLHCHVNLHSYICCKLF